MSEKHENVRHSPLSIVVRSLALALILGMGAYLLFANLDVMRIVDYDEARHGVNAYEMIRNDDYLMSTYGEEPDYWNLKPPLSYWSIALSYKLFGYNAFALRFHSALSMLLCMLIMSYWLLKRFGWTPMLVAMAFLVCNGALYGNHFARYGDADAQYQLFFTIAMLCMMMSRKNFRWLYGSAFCFAMAFMDKATHAFAIPLVCLTYVICTGLWRKLNWKRILLLAAWGLTPIVIWAAARYSRDGWTFFHEMFFGDVVNRVGRNATGDTRWGDSILGTLGYFVDYMLSVRVLPLGLALCAVCAVTCLIKRTKLTQPSKDVVIGASLWFVVPIAFYSVMRTQFLWYIFHVFMALPVLIAAMLSSALGSGGKQIALKVCIGLSCALLCYGCWLNVGSINSLSFSGRYQEVMNEYLDRDADTGLHAYIQYNEEVLDENGEAIDGEQVTTWMQGDRLAAYFAGDVVCIDGGVAAFEEDEEPALLIIGRDNNLEAIDEVLGYTMPRFEGGLIYVLDK